MSYKEKYLKYKNKYLSLKNQLGAGQDEVTFIGKGAYGCVYKPPFYCENLLKPVEPTADASTEVKKEYETAMAKYNDFYNGKISKLMLKKDAEHEIKISELIKKIDPDQNYTLYPMDRCKVNPDSLFDSSGNYLQSIQDCLETRTNPNPLGTIKPEDATLVFYKYGGIDLSKIKLLAPQILDAMLSLQRLFEGIIFLKKNGVVHMDLKRANMVMLLSGTSYTPYLIDFGLTIKSIDVIKKILNTNYPSFDSTDYWIWAPELKLLSKYLISPEKRTKNNAVMNQVINFYCETGVIEYFVNNKGYWAEQGLTETALYDLSGEYHLNDDLKKYFKKIFTYIWLDPTSISPPPQELKDWLDTDYNEVKLFLNKLNLAPTKKFTPIELTPLPGSPAYLFLEKFMASNDAFSFGITLSELLWKFIGIISTVSAWGNIRGYKINSKNRTPKTFFTNELHQNLVVPLEQIIVGLTNFRFTERISLETALEQYKDLTPIFNLWLNKPEFIKFYNERTI